MVTPGRVAIPMVAMLAPLVAIAIPETDDMVPVPVTIFAAVAIAEPHTDAILTDADTDFRDRRHRHRQHCGTYQTESELFHSNLLRVVSFH
jgi:hypothetical protein